MTVLPLLVPLWHQERVSRRVTGGAPDRLAGRPHVLLLEVWRKPDEKPVATGGVIPHGAVDSAVTSSRLPQRVRQRCVTLTMSKPARAMSEGRRPAA